MIAIPAADILDFLDTQIGKTILAADTLEEIETIHILADTLEEIESLTPLRFGRTQSFGRTVRKLLRNVYALGMEIAATACTMDIAIGTAAAIDEASAEILGYLADGHACPYDPGPDHPIQWRVSIRLLAASFETSPRCTSRSTSRLQRLSKWLRRQ